MDWRGAPRIGDYALIGDCHSAALVAKQGSIDWCCFHRFDQRAVFNRILDWNKGGTLALTPVGEAECQRAYRPHSNVLETRFTTTTGELIIVDAFAVSERREHTDMPPMQLLRLVRCLRGEVEIEAVFRPRFDYGLTVPRLRPHGPRLHLAHGGADALVLESDLPFAADGEASLGCRMRLRRGDGLYVAVTSVEPHRLHAAELGGEEVARRIDVADRFWRDWAGRCRYAGPYRDAVVRSALVLKALTNAPTGAIVAAPTTSLPETPQGARNWDYRYTWLRDAALHLQALFSVGYDEEARAFMGWLMRTTAGRARDLQVLYGVGGERLLPEHELWDLEGYGGARPVRIGNRATEQLQLDVYGHVLETAYDFHANGGAIDEEQQWPFLVELVAVLEERWREPDHGIWEMRTGRDCFVSSRVMAWVAIDRAIRLAEELERDGNLSRWRALRDTVRAEILDKGVHRRGGFFTRTYRSDDVDAAAARIPLLGLLPANDPRVLATLERIERDLGEGPLVRRYVADDGLPGREAAFVIASFWLVMAHARMGRTDEAEQRFEALLALRNDVGLLAEEIDADTGEQLGNFPQSFSHTGLIAAAVALVGAEQRDSAGARNAR